MANYITWWSGRMVEWFKAAVLKTAVAQATVGSNPTSSAIFFLQKCGIAWMKWWQSHKSIFAKKMANEAALVTAQPVGRRRKASLHCAKHNFTQKAQPFLPCHGVMQWSRDIFTKFQKLACLSRHSSQSDGGWSRSACLSRRNKMKTDEVFSLPPSHKAMEDKPGVRMVFLIKAHLRCLNGGKPPWFFHLRWYITSERRSYRSG